MLIIPFCDYISNEMWCEYSSGGEMPNTRVAWNSRIEGYGLIINDWLGITFEDIDYNTHIFVFSGPDYKVQYRLSDDYPHNVCERWMQDQRGPIFVQDGSNWLEYTYMPDPLKSSMINVHCLDCIASDISAAYKSIFLKTTKLSQITAYSANHHAHSSWDLEGIYKDSIWTYKGVPPEYPWKKWVSLNEKPFEW